MIDGPFAATGLPPLGAPRCPGGRTSFRVRAQAGDLAFAEPFVRPGAEQGSVLGARERWRYCRSAQRDGFAGPSRVVDPARLRSDCRDRPVVAREGLVVAGDPEHLAYCGHLLALRHELLAAPALVEIDEGRWLLHFRCSGVELIANLTAVEQEGASRRSGEIRR